jgi:hypothetical protein
MAHNNIIDLAIIYQMVGIVENAKGRKFKESN